MEQTRRGFIKGLGMALAGAVGGGFLLKAKAAEAALPVEVPKSDIQTFTSSDGEYFVQEATIVGRLDRLRGHDRILLDPTTDMYIPDGPRGMSFVDSGGKVITVAKISYHDKKTGFAYGEILQATA